MGIQRQSKKSQGESKSRGKRRGIYRVRENLLQPVINADIFPLFGRNYVYKYGLWEEGLVISDTLLPKNCPEKSGNCSFHNMAMLILIAQDLLMNNIIEHLKQCK